MELLETWHVREAFKVIPVKSDRSDARRIAQLMRLGCSDRLHCKSLAAQELRAVLARKLIQSKLREECAASFAASGRAAAGRVHELVAGRPGLYKGRSYVATR
ncbi:hypothetical protein IHQ72_32550 [Mesorhizobium onobrychidis]|uniref:Transposase IS111A/IS1328/IS1533 N-terminal domain-containing protein n=1 Tax=Mesorhizobium onobrychidis TaxID=2775404 RepID=A0ABY5QVV8_9HYPH|nr:hypothetical protein [Mesorhizobium onobrychidis]UVC15233.1 hypothetical protein IHQ72_32550 [Mesorhizobium onobrychidis]